MAARSVGTVLEGLCERVVRDAEPTLLDLANVRHLATRFRGTLQADTSALAVAAALHPTAAVGGSPTETAIEMIRRLEGMDRGRYAGPVGWMDTRGDGEFAIALRCAELSGARARLFAGAGIVEGSLPEAELEETRIKLSAMLTALE
jgi:menaquinone-specific isochorismate synthase